MPNGANFFVLAMIVAMIVISMIVESDRTMIVGKYDRDLGNPGDDVDGDAVHGDDVDGDRVDGDDVRKGQATDDWPQRSSTCRR